MTLPRPVGPDGRPSVAYLSAEGARSLANVLGYLTEARVKTGWTFDSVLITSGTAEDQVVMGVRWDESIPGYVAEIR